MAPSSPSACLLQTTHLRTFLIISLLVFVPPIHALKPPIRPWDRQLSRPILNSLHSAVDLLPTFVGSVSSNDAVGWTGTCFYKTSAWMEFNNKSGSEFGGGTLHIKVSNAHSWKCMDLYVFATPYQVTWDYYFLSREHTIQFDAWEEKAEFEYVKNEGVSVFLMHAGMRGTLEALWDVFPLFTNTGWGENANLGFLKKHMGASFQTRPQPWVTNISVDDIHSGDFLAISKIRGWWSGVETLGKWVTGSYAGHSAVCLRDSEGKLWVGESGRTNEKGEDVIVTSPWDEWWDDALTQDDSNSHIALLPLHPHLRAKFNETAAWEYARSMEGKPYGYHNMIFSWIDTLDENYPPPLDAHVVAAVMTVWNQMWPAYAAKLWNEALNKRLGTQDDWVYTNGKSTSCVAFVLEMYKEAGLFGPIASSIQGTEFTNDIHKNPAFRSQFHEMCAKVGVDPLASNKGFWAELLGIGDFYYELGTVQFALPET